ncbi:hypothetical protein EXIGLDRAFT_750675 [Exidia glandulosa HHB12029]|uniref:F-box domain-containing protein n=1 Tax=Exidia glandulosa HHB12029 TaxID=1314781 RepID=A0A165GE87_EXIGL|nr:hypothetical protein EXIGLDRAFT_750675 [Exidia glandulosa HHB12029]
MAALTTAHTTNIPATEVDAAVIIAHAAVQQSKIDAAAAVLAEAKLQLSDADAVFAEAQSRFKAAETAYEGAKTRGKRLVLDAQRALDEALHDMSVIRAPFHPIRRTPPEVLGAIFEFCVDLDLSQTSSPEFKTCRLQPFTLARVCRLWRCAALMQHRVWSNINITLDGITLATAPQWRQYLSNMFARSGKSMLNLRVSREDDASSADGPIIRMILPELQRCDTLVISMSTIGHDDHDDFALRILQAELPALRELHLDISWMHHSIDPSSLLRHTPLLRNLGSRFSFAGTRLNMPHLVSATLEQCSAADACLILASAKSLQTVLQP